MIFSMHIFTEYINPKTYWFLYIKISGKKINQIFIENKNEERGIQYGRLWELYGWSVDWWNDEQINRRWFVSNSKGAFTGYDREGC